MHLLILIIIVFGCSYIGYGICNYYKSRYVFFKDFVIFLEICEVQIVFYHNKINTIFANFLENNQCSKEFSNFLRKIQMQFKEHNKIKVDGVLLNVDEQKMIVNFFNNLGKTNSQNQKEIIEFNKTQFKSKAVECENIVKKNAPLATKLGFLLGLAIAICLY